MDIPSVKTGQQLNTFISSFPYLFVFEVGVGSLGFEFCTGPEMYTLCNGGTVNVNGQLGYFLRCIWATTIYVERAQEHGCGITIAWLV